VQRIRTRKEDREKNYEVRLAAEIEDPRLAIFPATERPCIFLTMADHELHLKELSGPNQTFFVLLQGIWVEYSCNRWSTAMGSYGEKSVYICDWPKWNKNRMVQ